MKDCIYCLDKSDAYDEEFGSMNTAGILALHVDVWPAVEGTDFCVEHSYLDGWTEGSFEIDDEVLEEFSDCRPGGEYHAPSSGYYVTGFAARHMNL